MSKNSIPKGYTNQTVAQLARESQKCLFELGQAHYNEEFSIRQQNKLQDRLEELEEMLEYAKRQEQAAEIAKKNAEVRKENAKAKQDTEQTSTSQTETAPQDSQDTSEPA